MAAAPALDSQAKIKSLVKSVTQPHSATIDGTLLARFFLWRATEATTDVICD